MGYLQYSLRNKIYSIGIYAGFSRSYVLSPVVMPFCTSAEKPPSRSTPTVSHALSIAHASFTAVSTEWFSSSIEAGDTDIRLLTISTP
jgi:hypothetical protein